ncbi:class D sortase [Virgibacillus halodenitrificans]|uniref:class D sortase n=1 Tax=Virgibacillus halodenitrificans TaxID=1482 RepID=UPI001371EA57|nr:class D sortase [Virgibacillus halodenitrificans]
MSKKKRNILLIFTGLIVGIGVVFTLLNGWSFMKGYALGGEHPKKPEIQQDAFKDKQKKDREQLYSKAPSVGEEIGELYIPKLNSTLPIYHGTNEDELEKGVGHFADSVLPGEADNSVLSGHRDTVFRRLGEVGVNDELIVTTAAGEFTYKIRKTRIVDGNDRTVIVPKPRATLTLSTCYPFHYIGAAPERFILEAYLIEG